jgi:hypothetical protein
MKIEPQPLLERLDSVRIDSFTNKTLVYGVSLGTTTLLAKIDNPFLTDEDKDELALTLASAIEAKIKKRKDREEKLIVEDDEDEEPELSEAAKQRVERFRKKYKLKD